MALTREQYIEKYYGEVIQATRGTKIFPEIAIMQGALESGNGNSTLASKYNNHFGIKADSSWKGEKVFLPTKEVRNGITVVENEPFRVYSSVKDSFRDYAQFLQENPRYTKAGVFTAKTPQEQADALQRAGYATAPYYAQSLKTMISRNIDDLMEIAKKYKDNTPVILLGIGITIFFGYRLYKLVK
jgi:flagellum-specific peptidoglycan hydrolase FlgJ